MTRSPPSAPDAPVCATASGSVPPISQTRCSRAVSASMRWIGPSPGASATLSLSRSLLPMKQKYSGRTTSVAPSAAARPTRRRARLEVGRSTLGVETICTAAIFIGGLSSSGDDGGGAGSAAGGDSAGEASPSRLRSTRSTFGSSHGPVTRNSRVLAAISGFLRKYCARKVPRPIAGLITA